MTEKNKTGLTRFSGGSSAPDYRDRVVRRAKALKISLEDNKGKKKDTKKLLKEIEKKIHSKSK